MWPMDGRFAIAVMNEGKSWSCGLGSNCLIFQHSRDESCALAASKVSDELRGLYIPNRKVS